MFRRSSSLWALVIIAVFSVSPTMANQRSLEIRAKEMGVSSGIVGNYFALIAGNNDYKHLPKLKTAVTDAKDIDMMGKLF